jgi:hypothetical protein
VHEKILLLFAAPVAAARVRWALYGPLPRPASVLTVVPAGDPVDAIANVLTYFDATRIVLAIGAPDRTRDLTGEIEDRFGRPVTTVS